MQRLYKINTLTAPFLRLFVFWIMTTFILNVTNKDVKKEKTIKLANIVYLMFVI